MTGIGPQKIIFVHQAKTAGSSLVEAFKASYGSNVVFHDHDNQDLWKMRQWRRLVELKIQPYRKYQDRAPYRVIHGHFQSEKYRRAFPEAFYLTFYRHPVQRLASQYYYWLRSYNPADTNSLRRWVYETKPDLVKFVAEYVKGRAQRFSPAQFDFVGITERFDDSMRLLKLHIPELVMDVGVHRKNPGKSTSEHYVLEQIDEQKLNSMLSAYSAPNWTRIPRQTGQPFHGKVDTDSRANWTAVI